MDKAKLIQAIDTTIARRGSGTQKSPIRVVRRIFTIDGILIAENDPASYTIETINSALNDENLSPEIIDSIMSKFNLCGTPIKTK